MLDLGVAGREEVVHLELVGKEGGVAVVEVGVVGPEVCVVLHRDLQSVHRTVELLFV